ncbi:UNKNOWN [Stylonychia lemnae]|uniref:Uncharacterized protein n=1 Tax=Stylonychia lemnae TaxID=5949 RepID=A0A078A3W3_STYLE|nr:UNKNOWN [Stylonychia lemnae]|eukprot:CDW76559.1 UNKNOWN [Stylonychia lemnae]
MQDSESTWRRKNDDDHMYQKFRQNLGINNPINPGTPSNYGKKNDRYVSPTFKSEKSVFGDATNRFTEEKSKNITPAQNRGSQKKTFETCQSQLSFNNHQNQSNSRKNDREDTSQNRIIQSPEYDATQLRAKGALNYKNFSQVQIGFNDHNEQAYKLQFSEKKNPIMFKMKNNQQTERIHRNNQVQSQIQSKNNSQERTQELFFGGKKKYENNHSYNSRMGDTLNHESNLKEQRKKLIQQVATKQRDQIAQQSSEKDRMRVTFNQCGPNHESKTMVRNDSTTMACVLGASTSQSRINTVKATFVNDENNIMMPEISDHIYYKTVDQNLLINDCSSNNHQFKDKFERIREYTKDYEPPDWAFYSSQQDPFQSAFKKKQEARNYSVDKLFQECKLVKEEQEVNIKKLKMQATDSDSFVQTFLGETLQLRNIRQNKSIEARKKYIKDQVMPLSEYHIQELQKKSLQNDEFGDKGVYNMIFQNQECRQEHYQNQQIETQDYLQRQQVNDKSKVVLEKIKNIIEDQKKQDEGMERSNRKILLAQQLKLEQNKKNRDFDKMNSALKKGMDKFMKTQFLTYDIQNRMKDTQVQLNFSQNNQTKRLSNIVESMNSQNLNKRVSLNETSNNKSMRQFNVIKPVAQSFNIHDEDNQSMIQLQKVQSNLQLSKGNLLNFEKQSNQSDLKQRNENNCLSVASTVSSCAQNQYTRANISQKEYEIRKKQIQARKNQQFKPLIADSRSTQLLNQTIKRKFC